VARSFGTALIATFVLGHAASAAGPSYLNGIDISHWQGKPDWPQAKADGVRFVFAKATEGRTFVDEEYSSNRAGALSQTIPLGAYHFARPDKTAGDAVAEADHFVDNASPTEWNLVPVLDLEVTGGLGTTKLKAWVWAWLNRVEERLGVKATIYTSPSFWSDHMGNARGFAKSGHRLWIAHWGAAKPRVPARNWAGLGWTFWQHSSTGSVNGIVGAVDLDRYNGTSIGALRIKNNR
jgi:GH25 family lysozyme M1 (1,4-beta-N-acetylmuramidase)